MGYNRMTDNELIATLEIEGTDLYIHTQLCHARYEQLTNKFIAVEHRFDRLEKLIMDVKASVETMKAGTQKDYLNGSLYIIYILMGTLGFLLAKFVI